jgi:hypothetical protein
VFGTFYAALATGLSFVAQYGYFLRDLMRKRRPWLGQIAPIVTGINMALLATAYVCFLVAGLIAYNGIS